jgi:hypothetical protein
MMLSISADGLVLDGSAKAMAELPSQAFGIMLSGRDIEDMIACVQNGGDIQLALGNSPVSMDSFAQAVAGPKTIALLLSISGNLTCNIFPRTLLGTFLSPPIYS